MGMHWSSANFFRNYPRQKRVLYVWFKMHILRFHFVGQILSKHLKHVSVSWGVCGKMIALFFVGIFILKSFLNFKKILFNLWCIGRIGFCIYFDIFSIVFFFIAHVLIYLLYFYLFLYIIIICYRIIIEWHFF